MLDIIKIGLTGTPFYLSLQFNSASVALRVLQIVISKGYQSPLGGSLSLSAELQ